MMFCSPFSFNSALFQMVIAKCRAKRDHGLWVFILFMSISEKTASFISFHLYSDCSIYSVGCNKFHQLSPDCPVIKIAVFVINIVAIFVSI